MTLLAFAIQLLSGAVLLIFAVHLVQDGLLRLGGPRIRRQLGRGRLPGLLAKGGALGFGMQGGTAVTLMAAGLAERGAVPIAAACALALGAEFGSALAANTLHATSASAAPLLIVVGGWGYLRAGKAPVREAGRLLLGVGLIFLALGLIRAAVAPLEGAPQMATVVALVSDDPVNAVLLGLALTLVMQSSLVAMLTAASFAAGTALPPTVLLGLVAGANMGSALLPLWLLRGAGGAALAVARTAAGLRVGLALCLLALLVGAPDVLAPRAEDAPGVLLLGHLAFNAALLPLALLAGPLGERLSPPAAAMAGLSIAPARLSDMPDLAISDVKRRVNAMVETLGQMVETAAGITPDRAPMIEAEGRMNDGLRDVRATVAALPSLPGAAEARITALMDYAVRLERCADILSGKVMAIHAEAAQGVFDLPPRGADEIASQLDHLRATMLLAQHVFWNESPTDAHTLIERKQAMARLEEAHRHGHFARLRSGAPAEMAASDQYLELIAALKEISSKLATIGYVVLGRHDGLAETRLKRAHASDIDREGLGQT